MKGRQGEQQRRHEGHAVPGTPLEQQREGGNRARPPEDGGQLAHPVGRMERLDAARHEVVEGRMHGVEPQLLPEKAPVALDKKGLGDLVEAVGKGVEPEAAQEKSGGQDRPERRLELQAERVFLIVSAMRM